LILSFILCFKRQTPNANNKQLTVCDHVFVKISGNSQYGFREKKDIADLYWNGENSIGLEDKMNGGMAEWIL